MTVVRCKGMDDFQRKLGRDMKLLRRRLDRAVAKTSRDAVGIVRRNSPKAFGELRESVHADDLMTGEYATVVGAPHAAAVEVGSRPHIVPLEELVKWVKLRGMQGLDKRGGIKSRFGSPARIGTTTAMHARSIATQIRAKQVNGATPIDAPEQIARAIQASIARVGTVPHWYVKNSLPAVASKLDRNIKKAIGD